MTPLQLLTDCKESIALAEQHNLEPSITLCIPKGSLPNTFPKGELLNEMKRDGVVERTYRFDPRKVQNWLITELQKGTK
jgi:hypothetical protein